MKSASIARYSFNGTIISCQPRYSLVNGQCVIPVNNCMSYNQFGQCQICQAGFDMAQVNTCAARSRATCANSTGNTCTQAASGYTLANGMAYLSSFGYNAANNQQSFSDSNGNSNYFAWKTQNIWWPLNLYCAEQSAPNQCRSCQAGNFKLVNGTCVFSAAASIGNSYNYYGLVSSCPTSRLLFSGDCVASNCVVT